MQLNQYENPGIETPNASDKIDELDKSDKIYNVNLLVRWKKLPK
jgi:hypothetical protein